MQDGGLILGDAPGLGIELNDEAIAAHPYVKNPFPSLWDADWALNFTQHNRPANPSKQR